MVIFFKKLKTFALCSIVRNDSSTIGITEISTSGTKFSFVIKQKIIIIFKLSEKKRNFSKNSPTFFFDKKLEFSCESQKTSTLISSCFNNDEDRIFLSFSNGKILFINFNGKIFSILKMENPVFNINPGIGITSNLEFFGLMNKEFLVNYSLITKKPTYFKESQVYIIKKNSIISIEKNTLKISCKCHGKVLTSLHVSLNIKKILLIENNKILVLCKNLLVHLEVGNFSLKFTKIYHFEGTSTQEKLFKSNDQLQESGNQGTFLLIVSTKSNCLEIKPLDEKIKFLVTFNTFILKNNQINAIRFFGKKNSIIIGNDTTSVKIFNGPCFKFIGTLNDENMIASEIIIKENLLVILSNFSEILILNLPSLILLEKINFSNKITIDFLIWKKTCLGCKLICGFEDGRIKAWDLIFSGYKNTHLKLFWNQKIVDDTIISTSMSMDGKFIAVLAKEKGIFLVKLENGKFISRFESVEKKLFCIKFCPRSRLLVAGNDYGSVILFNILENSSSKIIKGDGSSVLDFNFNVKGFILVASYADGTIKIISIYNSLSFSVFGNHTKPIWGCAVSTDEQIITGCLGGQLTILRDISIENSKKQNKKFSRILFLKKSLNIEKKNGGVDLIFERLVFTKNSFMLMDFLEFSFKKNSECINKVFSKMVNPSRIHKLNFTFKTLILWNRIKKKQIFVYKLVLKIFGNLKFSTIAKLNISILKGTLALIKEWVINIRYLEKLNY